MIRTTTTQATQLAASTMLVVGMMLVGCTPQGDPSIASTFTDNFDRNDPGVLWYNTGANWRIVNGQLNIQGARNRPIWLRRTLPRDVRIEFDARSESTAGDIKVEVFGDGRSRAESESYTATSYVVIMGAWNNTLDGIARMDEHAQDRRFRRTRSVVPGRTYHFKIERRGNTLTAWVDGVELEHYTDPNPLAGRGHDHFAFNNWMAELYFDNLVITRL